MVNGEAIVAQVRQGSWPHDWQVLRAKPAHFIRLAIFIALFLILAAAGLIYLVGHPGEVFTLGAAGSSDSGPLDPTVFSLWRTADFAVLLLVLAGCGVSLVITLIHAAHANEHLLIVFPEGFVLKTGRTQTFAFATIQALEASIYRGVATLRIVAVDGQKFTVRLDARFGNARQVAQRIVIARNQFAAAPRPPTVRGT